MIFIRQIESLNPGVSGDLRDVGGFDLPRDTELVKIQGTGPDPQHNHQPHGQFPIWRWPGGRYGFSFNHNSWDTVFAQYSTEFREWNPPKTGFSRKISLSVPEFHRWDTPFGCVSCSVAWVDGGQPVPKTWTCALWEAHIFFVTPDGNRLVLALVQGKSSSQTTLAQSSQRARGTRPRQILS